MAVFTLGHLSDLHATPVRASDLRGGGLDAKHVLSFLSWHLRRRHEHRPEVLARLIEDLAQHDADHVVVTGDLTNLGLRSEIAAAREWLERLGDPRQVSLVPGNHDAYTVRPGEAGHDAWSPWIASDAGIDTSARPVVGAFPTLRFRGPVALVGLCSAHPTSVLKADGTLGEAQRRWLERVLADLGAAGWCRVVLVHHPPVDAGQHPRRRLNDGADLREVLGRVGAELVLHGHTHRTTLGRVEGPWGAIPVVGVRSASARGRSPGKAAQYHLYRIERAAAGAGPSPWRIRVDVRAYDPERRRFAAGEPLALDAR